MLCKNCGRAQNEHIGYGGIYRPNCLMCPIGKTEWKAPGQAETVTQVTNELGQTGVVSIPSVWAVQPVACSNPKFGKALSTMRDMHDKKSADYAKSENRYSNFEEAAAVAGCSVDEVFATLIGIKLARLKELKGKEPKNESVQDSRLDLAVYATLWLSYHMD